VQLQKEVKSNPVNVKEVCSSQEGCCERGVKSKVVAKEMAVMVG